MTGSVKTQIALKPSMRVTRDDVLKQKTDFRVCFSFNWTTVMTFIPLSMMLLCYVTSKLLVIVRVEGTLFWELEAAEEFGQQSFSGRQSLT